MREGVAGPRSDRKEKAQPAAGAFVDRMVEPTLFEPPGGAMQ
jgi:hypothetical protein